MNDFSFHKVGKENLESEADFYYISFENDFYRADLTYLGDYKNDRKNHTVDRNFISVVCRGKGRCIPLKCRNCRVYLNLQECPFMPADRVDRFKEELSVAKESALGVEKLITEYFGTREELGAD